MFQDLGRGEARRSGVSPMEDTLEAGRGQGLVTTWPKEEDTTEAEERAHPEREDFQEVRIVYTWRIEPLQGQDRT
jgi:hypothetical protein